MNALRFAQASLIAALMAPLMLSASTAQEQNNLPVPQWAAELATPAPLQGAPPQVLQGYNLALAGDCTSCHTRELHEPMAGGVPVNTNFGAIYGANITPDRDTGIGAWTSDQFYRAMHNGIRANGAHLYPAFPYTSFTHITRTDSDALFAYLQTVRPVRYRPPPPHLPPILNIRGVMTLWNAIFFHPGEYRPDPHQSENWNRGAYLVTGVAHCDACHTPRNSLGAEKSRQDLQGGNVENWHASNLARNLGAGLGSWSEDDIVAYLATGRNEHAAASGMMGQVVMNSTSHMSRADQLAIAIYLRSLAPAPEPLPPTAAMQTRRGPDLFAFNCSSCHGVDAEGVPNMFPRLVNNSSLQARDPSTIIRIVLEGTRAPMTNARPTASTMPAFGWKLSDEEVATLLSYLRSNYGNSAGPINSAEVRRVRSHVHRQP